MTQHIEETIFAYSDGSAIGNPGPGGFGAILKWRGHKKEFTGGYRRTTNNRMELMGAIVALEALKKPSKVVVTTDSQYLVNAMNQGWAERWRSNGWKRNKKDKALNPDLWERLLRVSNKHQVTWEWVKGHSGHKENERCDFLANDSARNNPESIDTEFDLKDQYD